MNLQEQDILNILEGRIYCLCYCNPKENQFYDGRAVPPFYITPKKMTLSEAKKSLICADRKVYIQEMKEYCFYKMIMVCDYRKPGIAVSWLP